MNFLKKLLGLNQSGLIHLIPLLVILVGTAVGVYLVSKSGFQLFKPRATSESFEFINGNCVKDKDSEKVLTCPGPVQFKLISPLELGQTSEHFQLIKKAHAQSVGGKDYFCDASGQDKSVIYHPECDAVFDFLCDWGLFGSGWVDVEEHCPIGLECEYVSEGVFDTGARCAPSKDDSTFIPSAPSKPRIEPPTTSITIQATPRPTTPISRPTSTPRSTATSTPVPTSFVQPTSTPTPTPPRPTTSTQGGTGSTVSKDATLSLFPSSWTYNKGCNYSLQIRLNTADAQSSGADAVLLYDPTKLEATSITKGTIYNDYPSQHIDPAGKVLISGLASNFYTGLGILATVNFKVLEQAADGPTQVKFDFDPSNKSKTIDSNVVQRGTTSDVLSSVGDGQYTIGSGECPVGSNTGTGQTNPPDTTRTTTHFRFAENPASLETASWLPYTAGGVTVTHTFAQNSPGPKFIYAQFKDNQGSIINANPYPVQIELVAESSSTPTPSGQPAVSPTTGPTTAPTSGPTATPRPTSTPRPTPTPTVVSVSTCNVQNDISTWPNCSNQELMALPANLRDMLPNEAIINFSNGDLLRLFPKSRLATLPNSRTQSFSNDDLLAIADSTGNRIGFLSNFSCSRLSSFSIEIQQQAGCVQ